MVERKKFKEKEPEEKEAAAKVVDVVGEPTAAKTTEPKKAEKKAAKPAVTRKKKRHKEGKESKDGEKKRKESKDARVWRERAHERAGGRGLEVCVYNIWPWRLASITKYLLR